jgi:hypothetical protein
MVLPPPMQSSLPAGWLAFTGRESNPLDRFERFQIIHPPFLDLAWRKGSFIVASPSREGSFKQPRRHGRLWRLCVRAARQAHCKSRAFARLARHCHVAAHHAGELAANGKAETGAAEALRRRLA